MSNNKSEETESSLDEYRALVAKLNIEADELTKKLDKAEATIESQKDIINYLREQLNAHKALYRRG